MSEKFINLNELLYNQNNNSSSTKQTYDKILSICHRHIMKYNKMHKTSCIFKPPLFLFGYPVYDINNLLDYLIISLCNNGFKVDYIQNSMEIYISWDINNIDKNRYNENYSDTSNYTVSNYNSSGSGKSKENKKSYVGNADIVYNGKTIDKVPINTRHLKKVKI